MHVQYIKGLCKKLIFPQKFQANVAEVRDFLGALVLEDVLGGPEAEAEVEAEPPPRKKKTVIPARTDWKWEEGSRTFSSKDLPIFPEPNYTQYKGLSPKGLYEQIINTELLDKVRDLSNHYAMANFGTAYNITSEEIKVFFAIMLPSGYNPITDYDLYWSNSDDLENKIYSCSLLSIYSILYSVHIIVIYRHSQLVNIS